MIPPSPAAAGDCQVTLSQPQIAALVYDPFITGGGSTGRITVDAAASGELPCEARVTLADPDGNAPASLAAGPLALTLEPLTEAAGTRLGSSASEIAIAFTPEMQTVRLSWNVAPMALLILPPGDYSVPFTVRESGAAALLPPVQGMMIVHSVARAQANLAGSFGAGDDAYTLDLGELHDGAKGRAILQVRSNVAASLSFRSRNLGKLVRSGGDAQDGIDYALTADGRPVPLIRVASLPVSPSVNLAGTGMMLEVSVGSVRGKTAGRYSDTVTIDIN